MEDEKCYIIYNKIYFVAMLLIISVVGLVECVSVQMQVHDANALCSPAQKC